VYQHTTNPIYKSTQTYSEWPKVSSHAKNTGILPVGTVPVGILPVGTVPTPPMLAYNTFHVLTPSLGWQVLTSDLHIVEILWRSFSKVNTTNTTNCSKQLIKSFAACTTLSLVVIIYLLHPVQVKNVIAVIMAQNQCISILNTLFCPELQLSSVSTLVTSRISCSWWHCSLTTRN